MESKENEGGTEEAVDPANTVSPEEPVAQAGTGGEAMQRVVSHYREMAAKLPELVPEMVAGTTIEEIDASVEGARRAYEQISRSLALAHEAHVPAGNPARSYGEAAAGLLKPEAKIALGLRGK